MKKWVFALLGAILVLSILFHGGGRANAAEAGDFTVQLTSDLPSGQPVGSLINWSVIVDPPGNYDYRLSYARYGEPLRLMYDFQEDSVFEWSLLEDGAYAVLVTVRNRDTGETVQATHAFFYAPRIGSQPLVSASGHPLVALYSAPPCPAGNSMRVVFWRQGNSQVTATDKKACDGVHSMNFYIAGMYPISFYWMKHETFDAQGQSLGFGPNRYFVTGVILHQDWVAKINYANGTGDGAVLWRLGPEGDFTLETPDETLWNTHQHDASFISADQIILYDNGNTRCAFYPELCFSRGQVYQINEDVMTATLTLNADLQTYAFALGSAQTLSNGNFHFDSGIQTGDPANYSLAQEVLPDGSLIYEMYTEMPAYRSFRLANLYLSDDFVPPPD